MKTYLSSINGKMRHDNIPWNADMMISDLGLKPIGPWHCDEKFFLCIIRNRLKNMVSTLGHLSWHPHSMAYYHASFFH